MNIINSKFKKFFKKNSFLKSVLVSLITILITLIIIFGLLWYKRAEIFKFLAVNLPKDDNINNILATNSSSNEKVMSDIEEIKNLLPKKEEDNKTEVKESVVNAVRIARPAVVAIALLKEVPKYNITYTYDKTKDDNGNVIPNLYTKNEVKTPAGTEWKQVGSGSGFLVNSEGLIVTNKHVVDTEGIKLKVYLNSGKEYEASVLAKDSVLDIALVKINTTGLPYLSLADSNNLEVGESVVAIGNALGEFKNTVSSGVISDLSRSIIAGNKYGFSEKLDQVIQTDAAINKGNSGGPLLNLKGEVVGINVAVVEDSSNIGFALPINSVKDVISQVEKTGKIIRPYVGIRYIPINEEIKTELNLSVNYGILLEKGKDDTDPAVIPNSPAEKAGLKEGDIILEVDGVKISGSSDFAYLIRNKKVGDYVVFKLLRDKIEKNIIVKLEQAPNDW